LEGRWATQAYTTEWALNLRDNKEVGAGRFTAAWKRVLAGGIATWLLLLQHPGCGKPPSMLVEKVTRMLVEKKQDAGGIASTMLVE